MFSLQNMKYTNPPIGETIIAHSWILKWKYST